MTTPSSSQSRSLFDGVEHMTKPFSNIFRTSKSSSSTRSMPFADPTPSASGSLTVIELFQSQGCNSCPPTNSNLINLVTQAPELVPDVLLLTYHVTYWDYLGWRDVFGQKAFDQRQREYVNRMKLRSAFTPQVIVNGKSSGVGNSKGSLGDIMKAGSTGDAARVKVAVVSEDDDEVVVSVSGQKGSSSDRKLQVTLVTYDPNEVDVSIPRGENAGRTLPHVNVVKDVTLLGQGFAAEEHVFVVRKAVQGRKSVVLVQDGVGGPVLGAVRM